MGDVGVHTLQVSQSAIISSNPHLTRKIVARLERSLTVCSPQIYAYDISKILLRALSPQWFLVASLCVGVTEKCERADKEAEENENRRP